MSSESLILIGGPTASGKTALSLELARQLNGAIISADSRMVYQGLDIGTGKPTWEYRQLSTPPWLVADRETASGPVYMVEGIEHHLLDVAQLETQFTLTDWLSAARQAVADIRRRGLRPIVVGGTGLYLKALAGGYTPPPTDQETRAAIERLSTDEILAELQKIDPKTAERERQNRRRLVRALEVVRLTGQAIGVAGQTVPEPAQCVAINRPRGELYAAIDRRTHEQLRGGMIDEVRALLASGVSSDWLNKIGLEYRCVTEWLESGVRDERELQTTLQGVIHAYARRQITYLRTQLRPKWVDWPQDSATLSTLVK